MPRERFSAKEIITKLRQAEVELSKGRTVAQVCKTLEVNEQTYYRWRKEYGGIRTDQAKRLKELERENARADRQPQQDRCGAICHERASSDGTQPRQNN